MVISARSCFGKPCVERVNKTNSPNTLACRRFSMSWDRTDNRRNCFLNRKFVLLRVSSLGRPEFGSRYGLSKTLASLKPLKHKINVIHGLSTSGPSVMAFTRRRPDVCSPARTTRREPSSKRVTVYQMLARSYRPGYRVVQYHPGLRAVNNRIPQLLGIDWSNEAKTRSTPRRRSGRGSTRCAR